MMDVCLLGSGGMMPLPGRWLSSLLIRVNGKMILIDCGEGTQIPLKSAGWGFKAIDTVLFTHYHGDHVAGLPGFLLTLGNSGRVEPLTLMGPPGLSIIVACLTVISPNLPFPLNLVELPALDIGEFKRDELVIRSMPAEHAIPCLAYSVELKRQGKFDAERAKMLDIPVRFWNPLQKGQNIECEGRVIRPEMVLGPARKGIKVCYCTDSRPVPGIIDFIKGVDLFVCEGMYGGDEDQPKAVEKKHMTFREAAVLARQGCVDELWLTHFSPSVTEPEIYLDNAGSVFPSTVAGKDLMMKTLTYSED